MSNLPEKIAVLASLLGTTSGLQRVNLEIDLLNARLTEKDSSLSWEELTEMSSALALLSDAIADMSRVARAMLAEAGVTANRVG